MLSKNIKKEIRSVATNERIRKSSNNKKHKQYSFKKIKCFLYEVNKQSGIINVLSSKKNKDIPSIPNEINT